MNITSWNKFILHTFILLHVILSYNCMLTFKFGEFLHIVLSKILECARWAILQYNASSKQIHMTERAGSSLYPVDKFLYLNIFILYNFIS